jgi:HEXXH motif-containing protein
MPAEHPQRGVLLRAFALELAADSDQPLTVEFPPCRSLVFPLSGQRADRPGASQPLRASTSGGEIVLNWQRMDGQIRWLHAEAIKGIRLDAAATQDLGYASTATRVRPPAPLAEDERSRIATALRLLEIADERVLREMQDSCICLTPPVDRRDLTRQSFSVESVPRVVWCGIADPFELADVISHEYHHLKLFLVEEAQPLMRNPSAPTVVPWRRDLRGARGLLHGCYVFFCLSEIFDRLFLRFAPSSAGRRRLLTLLAAVDFGIDLLRATDWRPTAFGACMASEIEVRNRERLERVAAADPRLARSVHEAIARHIAQAGRASSAPPWLFGE